MWQRPTEVIAILILSRVPNLYKLFDIIDPYCSDLVSYDVESDEVEVLCDGISSQSEE